MMFVSKQIVSKLLTLQHQYDVASRVGRNEDPSSSQPQVATLLRRLFLCRLDVPELAEQPSKYDFRPDTHTSARPQGALC